MAIRSTFGERGVPGVAVARDEVALADVVAAIAAVVVTVVAFWHELMSSITGFAVVRVARASAATKARKGL